MANFLITTANTLQEGTSTSDTFYFNTARGISIRGADGADTLTAGTANITAVNALLAGNAGNDTINLLSSFNANQASIYGGAGNDLISASEYSAVDTTMQGGGGNDTIGLNSADIDRGNLGLNAGNDLLSSNTTAIFNSAVVALGAGADTLTAAYVSAVGSTITGGGGADTINIDDGGLVGGQVNGDQLGDNTFFGADLITISAKALDSATTINGGYGNDTISASFTAANKGTFATGFINGNVGNDDLDIIGIGSGGAAIAGSAFVGGGAGADTITVSVESGGQSWGTLMGGGGNDTIVYSAAAVSNAFASAGTTGGFIQGGEGADSISFNGNTTGAVSQLLYTDATESNVSNIDTVSSTVTDSGSTDMQVYNVINVNTPLSRESAAGTIGGQEVYTGVEGIVTFTATFSDNVTDMVSALDANTTDGTVAVFSKGTMATQYLFMQGGAAGTADDLVVKVNFSDTLASGTNIVTNVDLVGNSAISLDI